MTALNVSVRTTTVIHGLFWLSLSVLAALYFFSPGLDALVNAWATPEYSHGPLIPVLSALLFLRQLKSEPILSTKTSPGPGILLLLFSIVIGLLGRLSGISDIVAYAMIFWVGAILLISYGWQQGKHFWPPVLHLVYMLPLPGVLYYKVSTTLQGISSELGVALLGLLGVPVFLDGNIIDLGTIKLQVAEACSGLRYLFPILSFSYVFAVLYQGPKWHKAILLLSAAPITLVMNSIRIAIAGVLVQEFGPEYLEGFSHFFEGWVIFMVSIILLFILAWVMIFIQRTNQGLLDALDLNTDGVMTQLNRLKLVPASAAMIFAALAMTTASTLWFIKPEAELKTIDREPFAFFPLSFGEWKSRPYERYSAAIERSLGADDYFGATFIKDRNTAPIDFFSAYYEDQSQGGIHSPEICLPGAGWEIAQLEEIDIAPTMGLADPFELNRVIIQKGESQMLVYYWFEQHGRHVAWDIEAKALLLWDGVTIQRTDGALVRLSTPLLRGEPVSIAEERLQNFFTQVTAVLPRFVPS